MNLRKEYFRTNLEVVVECVEKHYGKVEYQAVPEAFDFIETQLIEERGDFEEYAELVENAQKEVA